VPPIDNLSPLYRNVVGFWRHIMEKRVNPATGASGTETGHSPSGIVYTRPRQLHTGRRAQAVVVLKRLSGAADMLPR
jgi:hypothetical protein